MLDFTRMTIDPDLAADGVASGVFSAFRASGEAESGNGDGRSENDLAHNL